MVTASPPITSATTTGATSARSADRPAARVTTSSELRASPMNNTTVARIMISGRIWLIVSGVCSNVRPMRSVRLTS